MNVIMNVRKEIWKTALTLTERGLCGQLLLITPLALGAEGALSRLPIFGIFLRELIT